MQHIDDWQIVALPDFEIHGVMRRRNFQNAGCKLRIDRFVSDDGDLLTAMAFHPGDTRYVNLLGKHVWRPLAREKPPIIADEAIDPEAATGVLKVTPSHDAV